MSASHLSPILSESVSACSLLAVYRQLSYESCILSPSLSSTSSHQKIASLGINKVQGSHLFCVVYYMHTTIITHTDGDVKY